MNTIRVDVVSAEESIFSGEARFVALPGEAGELGIYPRHTPLISRIKAGSVRIEKPDGTEEFVMAEPCHACVLLRRGFRAGGESPCGA